MESNETENRRKQVLETSLEGIRNFLQQFKGDNVYQYVYEGDLQAALYNSIKSSLENRKLNYGEEEWFISRRFPKTKTPCLIHCEQWYKSNGKGRGRAIDIAVWDPTEENAGKHYASKDLLFLIEIKYRFLAKWAIKAVNEDYQKLERLPLKEYQRRLALTFTVAEIKKLLEEGNPIDACDILKGKSIQALVVCRDGIIEIESKPLTKN